MNDRAFINQQVRAIVDPLIMKLRSDLFNGNIYFPTLTDSLVPTHVIATGVQNGINQAVEKGGLIPSYVQFTAGEEIQTGKAVYYNGTDVFCADPTNLAHAGKVIGVASTPGVSGEKINVNMYGVLDSEVFGFTGTGTLFMGDSGFPSLTIPTNVKFIQPLGISLSGTKMLVLLSNHILVV